MPRTNLTPDELLTTTRAVRKRLDFSRPVPRALIEECIAIALQAPNGSNLQRWNFVVVTDAERRSKLAELYRRGSEKYFKRPPAFYGPPSRDDEAGAKRLRDSARYLVAHLAQVPVLVIPCIRGRTDGLPGAAQASTWASIFPATWSFQLALRARGLGSTFTTFHLRYEKQAATILGIPYGEVMQAGLLPVAYTKRTDFKPGPRRPLSSVLHWDAW